MSQMLSRFNNKNFLSLSGNGVVSVFMLLISGLVYHYLSFADVGKWFFFLTFLSLCDAARNGSLNTATIKFYAGADPLRGSEVLGSVWFLAIAITLVVLLLNVGAYYLLPFTNNPELIIIIKWVGITFLSSLTYSVIYWKLQADENYVTLFWLKFVNSSSTLLAFFILAITKTLTLESALLYNFLTNCLTSLVAIIGNTGRIKTIACRSKECIMELVHYAKYSLTSTIGSTLLGSVDTFIITFMLGPAALAVYVIPMKLMQIIEMPLLSFASTGMSGMAIAFNNKDMERVIYILKKYAGMLTIAFIPFTILAFLFADTAVYLLGSHKYIGTAAANIFRLYMILCLSYPIDRFNGATLDIINKPRINLYKVLIMLAVNIAGDFAGIALFKNLYGVVAAAFLTHLAGIGYGHSQLNKYMKVSIPSIVTTGYVEIKLFIQGML